MRGTPKAQPEFIFVLDINRCVPANHPLRMIKSQVDAVLNKLLMKMKLFRIMISISSKTFMA